MPRLRRAALSLRALLPAALLASPSLLPSVAAIDAPTREVEVIQPECLTNETLFATNVTHLNFQNATVGVNTLHEPGGQLRFDGIGIVHNRAASLVITDAGGNYSDIKEVWDRYDPPLDPDKKNGKLGALARINLQLQRGQPDSGRGTFRFCIVDNETDAPMTAEKFVFTIYDIDQRRNDTADKRVPAKEQALFAGNDKTLIQMMPQNDIDYGCEDDSEPPCAPGVRTRFRSQRFGKGDDNPNNPNAISDLQLSRSVAITYADASCWEFEYDSYCPVDQPGYDPGPDPEGPRDRCNGKPLQGGNFIFAGTSERLVLEGVCVPSSAPLVTPAPSLAPSGSPRPSHGPSCGRVECCLDCFCCGPGTAWDPITGTCLADTASTTGDDNDECGQIDINACYNATMCTGEHCCGAGTTSDDDPDFPPGERCLCYGDHIPS